MRTTRKPKEEYDSHVDAPDGAEYEKWSGARVGPFFVGILSARLLENKDKVLIIHQSVAEHVSAVLRKLFEDGHANTHTNDETD